jgi:hypothetical protein
MYSIATSVIALLLSASTNDTSTLAFSPSASQTRYPHRSLHQSSELRPRPTLMSSSGDSSRTTTRLELSFIDTTAFFLLVSSSAIDSSSQLNSNEGLAEAVGTLALLSSVGMGVFGSKVTNPNWKYVYKTTGDKNDDTHNVVASFLPPTITTATTTTEMKEETTQLVLTTAITTNDSMSQEAKEVVVTNVEPITAAAAVAAIAAGDRMVEDKKLPDPSVVVTVAKTKTTTTPPPLPVVAMKPPPIVPEQGKASIPSKEILQSTEIAKVEVQKVGVAETKERMSTKSSLSSSPLEEEETKQQLDNSPSSSSTDKVGVVGIPKRSRVKRSVKGLSLLLAAGVVALARNVVKAYLVRGCCEKESFCYINYKNIFTRRD